jgi:hypothetical protein
MTMMRSVQHIADLEYAKFSTICVRQCAMCKKSVVGHKENHAFVPNWARCRGYRPAFIDSFVLRLEERYRELKRQTETSSTALIRFKTTSQELDRFVAKIKNAPQVNGNTSFNAEAYRHGRAAADKVNLNANALKGGNPEEKKRIG